MTLEFEVKAIEEVEIPEMMEVDVFKKVKSGELKTSEDVFSYCLSQGEEINVKISDNSIVTEGNSIPNINLGKYEEDTAIVTLYHFEQGWRLFHSKKEFIDFSKSIFNENEEGNDEEFLESINLKKPTTVEEGIAYLKEYCENWEVLS